MKFFLFALVLSLAVAKPIYQASKSYVTPITAINFEKQINKIRQTTKYVSIVHYFKANDGASAAFVPEFDKFTNEFRGVFRIGACDCDTDPKICEKEKVTAFPTFKIYPPQPLPSIDVDG